MNPADLFTTASSPLAEILGPPLRVPTAEEVSQALHRTAAQLGLARKLLPAERADRLDAAYRVMETYAAKALEAKDSREVSRWWCLALAEGAREAVEFAEERCARDAADRQRRGGSPTAPFYRTTTPLRSSLSDNREIADRVVQDYIIEAEAHRKAAIMAEVIAHPMAPWVPQEEAEAWIERMRAQGVSKVLHLREDGVILRKGSLLALDANDAYLDGLVQPRTTYGDAADALARGDAPAWEVQVLAKHVEARFPPPPPPQPRTWPFSLGLGPFPWSPSR